MGKSTEPMEKLFEQMIVQAELQSLQAQANAEAAKAAEQAIVRFAESRLKEASSPVGMTLKHDKLPDLEK